jgi:hypothetical protein
LLQLLQAQVFTPICQVEARQNAGTLSEIGEVSSTFSSDDMRKRLTTGTTMCKLVMNSKKRRHLRLVSVPKDANCVMWQDLKSDTETHRVLLRDIRCSPRQLQSCSFQRFPPDVTPGSSVPLSADLLKPAAP